MLTQKILKEKMPVALAFAGDLICGFIAVMVVYAPANHLFFTNPDFNIVFISPRIWFPVMLVLVFAFFGSYKSNIANFGKVSLKKQAFILSILFVVILLLLSYNILYTHSHNNPRYLIRLAACILFYIALMGVLRFLIELYYTYLLKKGVIFHKILLIFQIKPDGPEVKKLKRYITLNSFTLLGYCGTKSFVDESYPDIPFLGNFNDTPEVAKRLAVDEIIILNCSKDKKISQTILTKIEGLPLLVGIVPGMLETISGQLNMLNLSESPVISIHPKKLSLSYIIIKRIGDIVGAIFGLMFTALLFPFIAMLIKKSSPGVIFFRQIRLGKNSKPFMMYKFRTMYADAEKNGPQLAQPDDDRVTPVGRFLRKNHLDELPQFWNVLRGDMTLVGPRPERAHFAKILRREVPYYQYICRLKPGLTSLGMVKYGYAHSLDEMEERLLYDIIYINNISFLTDIQIIVLTAIYIVKKAFTRKD
ncbi:MAG: sugar transferase [Cytophagaceae bacterium]|jgi:exopolysaccharide biosynthesis polyprenyl glycosylphosphotransferase|nr:sugar transferase [Cytophagaceae bacterium]